MKKSKNNINIYNVLFDIAYILLLISVFCTKVVFLNNYLSSIKLVSLLLFLYVCLIQSKKYKRKTLMTIVLILFLNAITLYFSKETSLITLFLIVFASKNIEINKFIKKDIIFKILIIVFLFILSQFGLTNEHIFYRNGIQRFSFGFAHPNALGQIIASVIMEYIYIKQKKYNLIEIITFILLVLFIYYFPNSRTSLTLVFIVLFYKLFNKRIDEILNKKYISFIICNSWIIFTTISILIGILYIKKSNIGFFLDNLLNTRVRWIAYFLENYQMKLFGNKLTLISSETAAFYNIKSVILDNAYVRFLLQYGILQFTMISILINKMFKNAYMQKNTMLVVILLLFMFKGVSEHTIYIFTSNIFLIYLKEMIFIEQDENT